MSLQFVRTQLETGLTFAVIASQAALDGDQVKLQRTRSHAEHALRSALQVMNGISDVAEGDRQQISAKVVEVERRLRELPPELGSHQQRNRVRQ
jgi:hypothetical protein